MGTPTTVEQAVIEYPDDDGLPMSDNTKQLDWMVKLYVTLRERYRPRADVFVAANLLWYPVEGDPKTRLAPDAMVVFGRPPLHRGSYKQWEEAGIAPQVVFEVLSPSNTSAEMDAKRKFYERHGVEEFYVYDPDEPRFEAWLRTGNRLRATRATNAVWQSPRLGVQFDMTSGELRLRDEHGEPFRELGEVKAAELAERQRADAAERRAERLAQRMRELGIDPEEETR